MPGGDKASDNRYAIHVAKTALREGYKAADVDRILSIYADSFTDLSEGCPTFFAPAGKAVLKARLEKLFRDYEADLIPITTDIKVAGDVGVAYGRHVMTLRPKDGGLTAAKRTRYVEAWTQDLHGTWHIALFIDNTDQEPRLAEEMLRALSAPHAPNNY
ncbi:MAG TPA: nuclear transport factor 2 family protein [Terracidiphilus sp.]|jgi:ketosteroid isomerase-like protein